MTFDGDVTIRSGIDVRTIGDIGKRKPIRICCGHRTGSRINGTRIMDGHDNARRVTVDRDLTKISCIRGKGE